MVDALVSGASAARRAGSSPVLGTKAETRPNGFRFIFFILNLNYISSHSPTPTNMAQRILYLDFLRAIATFAVIALHVSAMCVADNSVFPSQEWEIANVFDSMTRFCVPIFVMISGSMFLNPQKTITVKDIYQKYITRIACALIFWNTVYSLFYRITNNVPVNIADIIHGPMHLWFLFMICGLYIATPILRSITKDIHTASYFIIIALIFTFFLPNTFEFIITLFPRATEATGLFSKLLSMANPSIVAGFSAYFILGHLIHNNALKHSKLSYVMGGVSSLAVIIITHYISHRIGEPILFLYNYLNIFTFMTSVAIFIWAKNNISETTINPVLRRIIKSVSNLSFGIYLVHMLVLELLHKNGINYTIANPILSIPLVSAAIFIISYGISYICHKIPYLHKIS